MEKETKEQLKVNEAVKVLKNHFAEEMEISAYFQNLALAEVEIMSMLELTKEVLENDDDAKERYFLPENVCSFLMDINNLFKLLEPLATAARDEHLKNFYSNEYKKYVLSAEDIK